VIVNVEPDRQRAAVEELQRYTGLSLVGAHRGKKYTTAVLSLAGQGLPSRPPAADVLVRSRLLEGNPFASLNDRPRSRHLPNTRLETLVFECADLDRYVSIQKSRGVRFVTDEIIRVDAYSFIQTLPSPLIGASYGFIQFNGRRNYHFSGSEDVEWNIPPLGRSIAGTSGGWTMLPRGSTRWTATQPSWSSCG